MNKCIYNNEKYFIYSKKTLTTPPGKNMDSLNLYGVMTVLATILLTPCALLLEGSVCRFNYLGNIRPYHCLVINESINCFE